MVERVVTNAVNIAAWQTKDILARGYLIATIESQQQRSLINCTTANQMWVRLSAQYLRNAVENRHVLQARFFEYRYKPDHDIMSHVTEVETMATELADVGAPVDAISIMTKIICTLPPSYRSFITAWDSVPFDERTMALLTSRLLKEESMAKRWSTGQPDSQDAAFFAHNHPTYNTTNKSAPAPQGRGQNDRRTRRGAQTNSRQRPYRFCTYHRCQIAGHTIDVCRKKLRDEEEAKKDKSLVATSNTTAKEETRKDGAFFSSTCFISRNTQDWFADSGCTQHMTSQREIFISFTPISSNNWTVKGIGTSLLLVRGFGMIEFIVRVGGTQRKVILEKVLYVPGLGTNLLSIAAVTDVGLSVHFIETKVTFSKDQTVVMVGERIGRNLYHLAIHPNIPTNNALEESACFAAPKPASIAVWHERLAHISHKRILKMASEQLVDGLQLPSSAIMPTHLCLGCVSGKIKRSPFPLGRTRANEVGQLIHSDVCGPMHIQTPGGAKFFVLFTDDHSEYRSVFFLKQKSDVTEAFKEYVSNLRRSETGRLIHTLRADNGGEFIAASLKTWLSEKAIRLETSAPHSPEQNGVSERANRTIVEAGRCLLHAKHLAMELWGEAVSCAVYTLNRVSNTTSAVTPYQLWYGTKPNISHLRIFGSVAFIHIPKAERRKLDSKSFKCFFVGYSLTQKAYRFWDPVGRKLKISRDVIFDEQFNTVSDLSPNLECDDPFKDLLEPPNPELGLQQSGETTSGSMTHPVGGENFEIRPDPSPSHVSNFNSPGVVNAPEENVTQNSMIEGSEENMLIPSPPQARASPYPLRDRQPKRQWQSLQSTNSQQDELYEPTSYTDAMNSPDAELWKVAIQDEYDSLMLNQTWSLSDLPPGRTCIKSRWIFKIKPGAHGSDNRYKARLVAKGFSQRPGIDFEETFSPVIKHDTLRVVLSLVAAHDLEMSQLDVKTAFLYGELDEEIYLQQPEGYVVAGKEGSVCRLHKCIYGLKQASRVWNRHFDYFIRKFGLRPSPADPCLYLRQEKGEFVILIIWVDDGLVCSDNENLISDIIEYLRKYFEMRCTAADLFVGLSIHRDRLAKTLFLSQPAYIKKILKRFNMLDCRPRSLPAEPGHHLQRSTEKNEPKETMPYREAVGSLMYLTVATRPDISYSVGQVSQFCENPEPSHWEAVKRILSYLRGTSLHGIRFGPVTDGLRGFTDSDYAGDVCTRRSTSAFLFLLHGGPVGWSSRRQSCVALSTTESEYVAACEAAREGVWLQRLLRDINMVSERPLELQCDNQSAIQLIKNPVFHQRTKHIDVRYHFIRELQEKGDINVTYVPTEKQLADPLTKPLPNPRFSLLRELTGIVAVPTNLI